MRRQLAEWFFERQLDEDFEMGKREGRRLQKIDLTFKLELALSSAPKSKQAGIAQALEIVRTYA
jgi:hypothetical protein